MSHSSYNNIKKYAAFIFMVFTVLSGSSEGFGSDSYIKVSRKAFIDILASNKLFIQDAKGQISQSDFRNAIKDNEGFKGFLDIIAEDSTFRHIQVYTLSLCVIVYCLNNIILKNNIWKNTVF